MACPLCGWSQLVWLQCRGRNWLSFCVRVENYLDLMYGSKLVWLLCAGREWRFSVGIDWLGFYVGGRNWLLFFLYAGRKWRDLMWGPINLVCVWLVELTWFQRRDGTWLDFSAGKNWIGCCVGGRPWFDFSAGIGIDLDFVRQSTMTCFQCLDRNEVGFCVGASKSSWY